MRIRLPSATDGPTLSRAKSMLRWLNRGIYYSAAVVAGLALGFHLRAMSFPNMPEDVGREFAWEALQQDSMRDFCFESKYAVETDASYNASDNAWLFTYSVNRPEFV